MKSQLGKKLWYYIRGPFFNFLNLGISVLRAKILDSAILRRAAFHREPSGMTLGLYLVVSEIYEHRHPMRISLEGTVAGTFGGALTTLTEDNMNASSRG